VSSPICRQPIRAKNLSMVGGICPDEDDPPQSTDSCTTKSKGNQATQRTRNTPASEKCHALLNLGVDLCSSESSESSSSNQSLTIAWLMRNSIVMEKNWNQTREWNKWLIRTTHKESCPAWKGNPQHHFHKDQLVWTLIQTILKLLGNGQIYPLSRCQGWCDVT